MNPGGPSGPPSGAFVHYYFIDCETTDAGPTASVCEFGFVETDADFNILRQHESLIDPEQMISPGASGIHGLTNKEVQDSPTLREFFYADYDGGMRGNFPGPCTVIGHQVSFDIRFIGPYIEGPMREVCTLRWARRLYPESDDLKLSTLVYALDLPRSAGAHRALADVMSAYHLARHVCERIGCNLEQLAKASLEPTEVKVCSFGKYKGVRFRDIPKGYLLWMHGNMKNLDVDVAYTLKLLLQSKNYG